MSDPNPNPSDKEQNPEKKKELQKITAPKTPIKKMSLADLMGDDEIQKFLAETEESEELKEMESEPEPKIEIRSPPAKKSTTQQVPKKQSKKLDNKDVLGAISQLSKLTGGEPDSIETEDISEASDEELKNYIEQLDEESEPIGSPFTELGQSNELYSYEQSDISLPLSPTELEESELEKEKKDLEKDLDKKIKTISDTVEEEKKAKLSIFGLKKRALPTKIQPKVLRRIGIAFICLVLLVPTILLIPSYETNFSRQLLSSPYLGYMVWKEEMDARVDPKFIPAFAEKFVNPSVQLVMAKGETKYFKFVIRSLFSTSIQAQILLSDFYDSENNNTIDRSQFDLLKERKDEGIFYPDKLEAQSSEFEVVPNTNYVLIIKYHASTNVTAGDFSGNMTLLLGNSQFIVTINLKIKNVEIPNHEKLIFYSGNNIDSITDIQTLKSLKISTMKFEYTYEYNATANAFIFNWTQFDLLMNTAIANSLEYVDISFRWNPPTGISQFNSQYNTSIIDAYTTIWNHMVANGWQNYTMVDLGYQYSELQMSSAAKLISLIKSVSSEIRVLCGAVLSIDSIQLLNMVDIWAISQLDLQTKPQLVNNLLANGKKILLAVEPNTQLPYMNLKLTNPLIHARLLPWFVFVFNLDGIYLYNTSDARPNAYGYGEDGLLTGLLLYRTDATIIPSLRWIIFSQGLEDLSYLIATKQIAQQNQDAEVGQNALATINQVNKLIKSYTDYSISSSEYAVLRLQLAEILG
jgi:hypothetical protein